MLVFLAVVPWLVLVGALPFLLRRRPALESYPAASPVAEAAPLVSVILPTRDDAPRVGACLASLLDTDYPNLEVVVVDHGSRDGTREIVEALEKRAPRNVRLVQAGPAPLEWPWRAWACERGYRESRGALLLFTEPGTYHDAELLPRAVSALDGERADLLSALPRLTMEGFWERLIMPHIWLLMTARFPSAERVNRSRNPRNVVAHHQFMLFRRESYQGMGRHTVMDRGAVEDLRLAQRLVGAGMRLFLVNGERFLETRMYRTFGTIAEDWTGAVPAAGTTVAPWAGVFANWAVALLPLVLFFAPPVVLTAALLVPGAGAAIQWGGLTSALSLVFWLTVYGKHRIRPAYALVYAVGGLLTSVILVRGILRWDGEPAPSARHPTERSSAD